MTQENLVGVAAATGELLWKRSYSVRATRNAVTPIVHNQIVIVLRPRHAGQSGFTRDRTRPASGHRRTCGSTTTSTMDMSTGVVIGNSLFGFSATQRRASSFAIDANTGQTQWLSAPRVAENAAVVRAGDLWFALDTEAKLSVARANPKQFEILKTYDVALTAPPGRSRCCQASGSLIKRDLSAGLALDAELRPPEGGPAHADVSGLAGRVRLQADCFLGGSDVERPDRESVFGPGTVEHLRPAYVHGDIDRRRFLDRGRQIAPSAAVTAAMLLDMLSPKFAEAQQVAEDDKRIKTEWVEIDSPQRLRQDARLRRRSPPTPTGKLPTIARRSTRTAASTRTSKTSRGASRSTTSCAFAPDALTPLGGYPGDEDKAREVFPKLDQAKTREDFVAAANYAAKRAPTAPARSARSASATAAAWSTSLATTVPELLAGVPFYGGAPPVEDVEEHQGRRC